MTSPDLDTPSRPPQLNLPAREPRDMAPLFQVAAQSLQNFANLAAPDKRLLWIWYWMQTEMSH